MKIFARILFAVKHKTFRKVTLSPLDSSKILVYHKGEVVNLKRRCPHQGAPLEKGFLKNGVLICPWHGCQFKIFPLSEEGQPNKPGR